ncbi:MAG: DUF4173 domain-containing protein [Armatimonas sp.]
METTTPKITRPALLLSMAVLLGIGADVLLYGQAIGLGWALFLLLLPGALLLMGGVEGSELRWKQLGPLLVAHVFFASMLAIRADTGLTALNLAACFVLLGLIAALFIGGTLAESGLKVILGSPFRVLGAAIWQAAPVVSEVSQRVKTSESGRHRSLSVIRGLLLAAPVLIILIPLLVSADPRFGQLLEHVFSGLLPKNLEERLLRLFLMLLSTWLVAGGLAGTLLRVPDEPRTLRPTEENPLGFIEGAIVLGSVATVFGAFLTLQVSYLFGGHARVQGIPNLTYSQYARHGFGELVIVATLTATLIQGLRAGVKRIGGQEAAFAGLATINLVLTLVLLTSAWQRMAAYEQVYGATAMRIWVDTFITWLGVVLVWLIGTLWVTSWSQRFVAGGLVCALGFGITVNLLNPERLAAIRNRTHPRAPEVKVTIETADLALSSWQKMPAGWGRRNIAVELSSTVVQTKRATSWQSWNLARARAHSALLPVEQELVTSATSSP